MAQFSTNDMQQLEQTVAGNFEDAIMIGSLAKLQQHLLHLSEKLNSQLSENVLKAQQQQALTAQTAKAAADKQQTPSTTQPTAAKSTEKKVAAKWKKTWVDLSMCLLNDKILFTILT